MSETLCIKVVGTRPLCGNCLINGSYFIIIIIIKINVRREDSSPVCLRPTSLELLGSSFLAEKVVGEEPEAGRERAGDSRPRLVGVGAGSRPKHQRLKEN